MGFAERYIKHRSSFDKEFEKEWEKGRLQRELSAQLIELRLTLGLNQSQFAELIGVKQPYLSRLENSNENISIQNLQDIARKAGASVNIDVTLKEPVTN